MVSEAIGGSEIHLTSARRAQHENRAYNRALRNPDISWPKDGSFKKEDKMC